MTDCAIESENARERERKHTKSNSWYSLSWESDIFLHTHTHKHRRKIFSIPTWDRARTPIRPRENIPNLRERKRVPLSFFFQTQAHFGGYFVQRTESLQKHITEANSKYHTCYSFVNYLCKSKNYKRKTFKKIHHIHSTIARESESESVRARARERESSETWVIS